MEKFAAAAKRAREHIRIADHMLTMTYPMVKDPKLLVSVLDNLYKALMQSVEAVLHYERVFKRIPAFNDTFDSKFTTFKSKIVPKYELDLAIVRFIAEMREYAQEYKRSTVAFARKDKYVLADKSYRMKTLDPEGLKRRMKKDKRCCSRITTTGETMIEFIEDAKEEIKRVDHQIYVSLKYTRTVDVFINIISRMIDGYDFLLDALLQKALDDKKIERLPQSPIEKGNVVKEQYNEELVIDNVELYFLLRKLFRSNPQREHEHRRNVTMRTVVEGREELVTIDIITNYYHFMLQFLKRVEEICKDA